MLHFEVGICVHTQKEMDEIFELILNTYPEAKGIKSKFEQRIELPMITINFLFIGRSRGYRFDKIYYSDDANDEEKNEILWPLTSIHRICCMEPISFLYKRLSMEEQHD